MDQPLLRQDAENFLDVMATEVFVRRERQFERGALDVVDEDVQVVGIDQRPLRRVPRRRWS